MGKERRAELSERIRQARPRRMLFLGAFGAMFLNGLIALSSLKRWFPAYEALRPALFALPPVTALLLYGILTPVLEEILFRGVLFGAMRKKFSFFPSALVSSLVFGLYHGNMVQFLYAFFFGFLLSFSYSRTASVLSPILVHGAANSCVCLAAWLAEQPGSGPALALIESRAALWNGCLSLAGFLGLCFCVRGLLRSDSEGSPEGRWRV